MCIEEMAENVSDEMRCDESVDINDLQCLAAVAKYCDSNVREELCCLKPVTDTTKGEAKTFIEQFDEWGIDVGHVFLAMTTDRAPTAKGKRQRSCQINKGISGSPHNEITPHNTPKKL